MWNISVANCRQGKTINRYTVVQKNSTHWNLDQKQRCKRTLTKDHPSDQGKSLVLKQG